MVKKVLLVGTLISTLLFGITGCDVKFGKMDYKDLNDEHYTTLNENTESKEKEISLNIEEKSEDIKEIDIKMNTGEIYFETTDNQNISIIAQGKNGVIKSEVKDGKIKIEDSDNVINDMMNSNIKNEIGTRIKVKLPKDFNKNVSINVGAGFIGMDNNSFDEMNINMGIGGIANKNLIKANKLDVKLGIGMVELFIEDGKNININQEIGESKLLLNKVSGNVKALNKIGEMEIYYGESNPKVITSVKIGENNTSAKGDGKFIGEIDGTINIGELTIKEVDEKELKDKHSFNLSKIEN